jgi:trigger factor
MIPGFEEQLLGLEVGQNKSFNLTFPAKYTNAQLAGKEATFDVEVVRIEMPSLPEIDEDFVKQYGIEDGNLQTFYTDVRNNMERELERALQAESKKSVLNAIYSHLNISVPTVLVEQEINRIIQTVIDNARQQNIKPDHLDLPRHFFESQAKFRVALSFILSKVIEQNQIQLDEQKVKTTIENLAEGYEKPEEIVLWYYEDRKRLEPVIQLVFENQAVDWLATQIQMIDETLSFTEVMDRQQR